MNTSIVDMFGRLKYPEAYAHATATLGDELAARGVQTRQDAEHAQQAMTELKIRAVKAQDTTALEMFSVDPEQFVKQCEAQAARKRKSGEKRSSNAMEIAAQAFIEAEQKGCNFVQALDYAELQLAEYARPRSRAERTDRKTLASWLRDIQHLGMTTIPPATKGRPKKE